jgi:plasmid maintenance system antidote protein VapI
MSVNQLTKNLGVSASLRLDQYFETSAEFWMNLQALYDLQTAQTKSGAQINRQVKPRRVA